MNRAVFMLICAICGVFLVVARPWQMPLQLGLSMIGFVFAILGLAWLALRRANQQQKQFEELLETAAPAGTEHTRRLVSIAILLVGGIFIFVSPTLPHGYIMVLFAVMGLMGFNVFRGGPLDQRRQARSDNDSLQE